VANSEISEKDHFQFEKNQQRETHDMPCCSWGQFIVGEERRTAWRGLPDFGDF
jgi:hypothetical protein